MKFLLLLLLAFECLADTPPLRSITTQGVSGGVTTTNKTDGNGSQYHVLTTPGASSFAGVTAYSRLKVSGEPSALLADKFDSGTLDANMWTSSILGTGTVSLATGNLTLVTGITAGNASWLSSVPTFQHPANAYLQFGGAIKIEASLVANTRRYWGFATGGGTYASPLTDGVVYEIDETATLRASIYNSGSRVWTQIITAPTDGAFHRYDIFYNTQNLSFFIDNSDTPVAKITTGINPSVQNLPGRIAMFNNTATGPTTAPILSSQAIAFTDTAHNNSQISDGKYGFRKASVDMFGGLQVSGNAGYFNVKANGTYVIKNSPGVLYSICFNTLVNGAKIVLYDNTAGNGTAIGTYVQQFATGVGSAYTWSPQCQTLPGIIFNNGLTLVMTTASDVTVYYK